MPDMNSGESVESSRQSDKYVKLPVWLSLSAIIVVLDLVTKYWASAQLDYAIPVAILPFFNLTLLHNTGAAFSFLADASGWQRWFFVALATLVSVVLVKWLKKVPAHDKWLATALALVLGGAIGNLYDRITLGYVVDFLHFYWQDYHFPAFNLADTAISIGAFMIAVDIFRKPQDSSRS